MTTNLIFITSKGVVCQIKQFKKRKTGGCMDEEAHYLEVVE